LERCVGVSGLDAGGLVKEEVIRDRIDVLEDLRLTHGYVFLRYDHQYILAPEMIDILYLVFFWLLVNNF